MRVGIDIDTWKLTLCAASDEVVMFETAKIRRPGDDFFNAILGLPAALAFAVGRMEIQIDEVYIERGRGTNRKGEYEMGAIYGATCIALRRLLPDTFIASVTTQEWKKRVTAEAGVLTVKGVPGNGNAPKAIANEACRLILREQYGLDPRRLTADELDAFGVVRSVELAAADA